MHCPQCGQQQAPEVVRFCSRCGFPLDGVIQLLANGGMIPAYVPEGEEKISPRKRGVKQGGILLLTGILLVPLLGILSSFSDSTFLQLLAAVAALLCFLGGPLRMLYAGIFEEGAPRPVRAIAAYPPVPMALHGAAPVRNVLPAAPPRPVQNWGPRPRTAELARPPSVTEGTTRLLDKDDPGNH
jgi:hypothetical protein